MELRDRLASVVHALPVTHRVALVVGAISLVAVAVPFVSWVTSPSYTLLYSGLDDQSLSEVVDGLETRGVPYRLEGAGSRVLVPRERLYETRASLAGEGVGGRTEPAGYEILDDQGLSVSDFRQRVDYRRALEGELARTLREMNGIREATVHLVTPERQLFTDQQQPTTASVLVSTSRTLDDREVEAITFLVASSVEGLEVDNITVADADGNVLHAPGDATGTAGTTNRNLRQTREYEQALAGDVSALLQAATAGMPASVVVRASMNYDESETQRETYDRDSAVTLREQTTGERYEGVGTPPTGGVVGIDGGPLQAGEGESSYERDEVVREYGVDRVTARTVAAPGRVEKLSVAIVMDDGSVTGSAVPSPAEVEQLVTAALGLDEARGDSIAVSMIPFPASEPAQEHADAPLISHLPEAAAAGVLLLVAITLLLMTRRRTGVTVESVHPAPAPAPAPASQPAGAVLEPAGASASLPAGPSQEVAELIARQPEEIASLLRGWLADRREVGR